MSGHDVIVVGAGPNGLAAAGLLARAGRRVLVLERREVVGGLAAVEEFHDGYLSTGPLHDTTVVRPGVIRALDLTLHGLGLREHAPGLLALGDDGAGLLLGGDRTRAAERIAAISPDDAEQYRRFVAFIDRVRPVVDQFVDNPPLDLIRFETNRVGDLLRRGLRLRRLGKREMLEFLRLLSMSVADWLDEWFRGDLLKAALAHAAIAGSASGPRSPGTGTTMLLHACGSRGGVVSGAPGLVAALARAAEASGAEIRTSAPVESILLSSGRVEGVRLVGGESLPAAHVACSCDPKHALLELLPRGVLASRTEQRIRKFRARGTTAQVKLAVAGPVRFTALPDRPIELARTGSSLDRLERACDAIKYRSLSAMPILEIHVPTVSSPQLAPDGHSVISTLVHFAPHDLEGGWDDGARERLGDTVVSILSEHIADLPTFTRAREVLAPPDLERRYGIHGGQIHHGETALDQLLIRPTPECTGYRTPVPGLYLCGSGSHPGGGLTLSPGAQAAATILSD